MNEIRKTEKLYKLPRKNLYKDGYRPLEFLINESKSHLKPQSDKKILIAPTWGKDNILLTIVLTNCLEIY